MRQSRPDQLRGLKALVAFLGILVVLGTAVVAGVIIRRLYASAAPASNFSGATLPPPSGMAPPATATTLPAGSRILGLAAAGGSFAVWVTSPAGGQDIYLLDPATGALRLSVQTPAPKN